MDTNDQLNNNEHYRIKQKNHVQDKIAEVYLEDETMILWRPLEEVKQYRLIPEKIHEDQWLHKLQIYYTKFDCVSGVLPFDDAVHVITHQATTLLPTQDYSILRNHPRIKGLWYKPDQNESIGIDDDSLVGNIKLSFSFPESEKENLLSQMNVYYLEVMDYGFDDKSVSRFLLTRNTYKDLHLYDIYKPGGPIYVKKISTDEGQKELYYFLRICQSFTGKIMQHVVEFMLEEDPWPLCRISAVTHKPLNPSSSIIEHSEDFLGEVDLSMRYFGASWEQSLAGLFAWSLRSKVPWLVYERLHDNIKGSVNLAAIVTPFEHVFSLQTTFFCERKLNILSQISSFIGKCQNEKDLRDLQILCHTLHTCDKSCCHLSIKHVDMSKVLSPYLQLLERVISCKSVVFRRSMMTSILPWTIMAYHFHNHNIESCMKMVGFIYQLDGIRPQFNNPSINSSNLSHSTSIDNTEKTSGVASLSTSPVWDDDSN